MARESDSSLDAYLAEVAKYPLINPEEEVRLAKLILEGDTEALQKLARSNLRFVISVAKQFQFRGMPLIDLIGEGNVGLMRAAKKFDPEKGVKFISYAVWWIRQAILDALAKHSRTVRIPLNVPPLFGEVAKLRDKYMGSKRRMPTPKEVQDEIGVSLELAEYLLAGHSEVSLDAPLPYERNSTWGDRFEDTRTTTGEDFEESDEKEKLHEILNSSVLNARERKILILYFGLQEGSEPLTLEVIGSIVGVTRERIRQIKEKALGKLRFDAKVGKLVGSQVSSNGKPKGEAELSQLLGSQAPSKKSKTPAFSKKRKTSALWPT